MTDSPKEAPKVAKAAAPNLALAANWNADDRNPIAAFHARSDAEAFADAYGGYVDAIGVVFTVTGSDAEKAKSDAAKASV